MGKVLSWWSWDKFLDQREHIEMERDYLAGGIPLNKPLRLRKAELAKSSATDSLRGDGLRATIGWEETAVLHSHLAQRAYSVHY